MICKHCRSNIDYKEYLKSPHWQEKRKDALLYADYRCQLCNKKDNLNIHHRTYENLWDEPLSDLIALCENCHAKFHDKLNEYDDDSPVERSEFYTKEDFRKLIIETWFQCHLEYNKGSGYLNEKDVDRINDSHVRSAEYLGFLTTAMIETYSKRRSNYWRSFLGLITTGTIPTDSHDLNPEPFMEDNWKTIIDNIARKNPSLAANLSKCQIKKTANEILEIEVPGDDDGFTLNMIKRTKNMAILQQTCEDVLGTYHGIYVKAAGV